MRLRIPARGTMLRRSRIGTAIVGDGLARPVPMQLSEYIENNPANWKEDCFYANAVRE
jgi:hypothetical protein